LVFHKDKVTVGIILTGAVVAGGSKASVKLFEIFSASGAFPKHLVRRH
jgi:hypothetical protein